MRNDLHDSNLFNAIIKSAKLSHSRSILSGNASITENGALVSFIEASGAQRDVTLPVADEGLMFVASNVGATYNVVLKTAGGSTVTTLLPGDTALLFASESEWVALRGWAALAVFTNSTNGLVPAPNSVTPGSLFLRDDGQWGQVQVVGIVDAFKYMSDGTNIATGAGPDTFKFRSSNGSLNVTVGNNDATHGDNVNLTVNAGGIDHNALLNYSANRHIDHTAVTLTAGLGISGGGDISASRSFAFDPSELTTAAPILGDYAVYMTTADAIPRRGTFTQINGILDHNALLNYSANRHIDHSTVSVIAGYGLSGGGAITSSVTLNVDFTEFPTDDLPVLADSIPFYDLSELDNGLATFTQVNAMLDHNALLNYSANRHIDHTAVSISAGTGLTGGGDISVSRTINLDAVTGTAALNVFTSALKGLAPASGGGTTNFLRADGTWTAPAGGGDVVGPASATDNAFVMFSGTTGKLVKNGVIAADSAAMIAKTAGRPVTTDLLFPRVLASGTVAAGTLNLSLASYTAYPLLQLILVRLVPSVDGAQVYMHFSTNGGGSYEVANYHYNFINTTDDAGGVNISPSASTSASQIVISGPVDSTATQSGGNFTIDMYNFSAASYSQISWHGVHWDDSNRIRNIKGSGGLAVAQDTDTIQISMSSGNITSMTYRLIGIP